MKEFLATLKVECAELDISAGQLRKFGLVIGVLCLLVGGYVWYGGGQGAGLIVGGIGVVLTIFGALMPRALTLPYLAWMGIALVLGFFVGKVLITVLFFVLVTPIGIVVQLGGKRPLQTTTYWKRHPGANHREAMRHPF